LHQPFDEVVASTVTTCFNGNCATKRPLDSIRNYGIDAPGQPRRILYEAGEAVDRGEGWTELVLSVPAGPYSDGDRYRVSITKADGSRVLDVERGFNYRIDEPNGSECEPTCHDARAKLYETSTSGLSCGGASCVTSVSIKAHLPIDGPSFRALLTLCRNDVCSTADGGLVQAYPHMRGALQSTLSTVHTDEGFEISMYLSPEEADLADGDVYRVKIVDPVTGTVLKTWQQSVTYDADFPNSPECDVFPCRHAALVLD
jgi:hypothetical protein